MKRVTCWIGFSVAYLVILAGCIMGTGIEALDPPPQVPVTSQSYTSFTYPAATTTKICFTMDDETATAAPHEVTLTIDTGTIVPVNLILFNPNSTTPTVSINAYPGSNNSTGITAVLANPSVNVFVLRIDALPNMVPRGAISSAQEWYLTVNLPSAGNVLASISSLDTGLNPTYGAHLDVTP